MINILIPLLTLLLTFLASLASLRYFLTRMGRVYWIIPFIISIIFFYQNIKTLIVAADTGSVFIPNFDHFLSLILSILWYAMIQAFHYAFKTEREYNKYVEESRRTYYEAKFINLKERRKIKKEIKERKIEVRNKPYKPTISSYVFPKEDEN